MIKNEGNVKNFWNGFIAGCVVAGACLYAFGTKKGRAGLKTLLDFSENMDTNVHKLVHYSQSNGTKKTIKETASPLESVTAVLDKMRHVSKHT